jgi:hypothetical protein
MSPESSDGDSGKRLPQRAENFGRVVPLLYGASRRDLDW